MYFREYEVVTTIWCFLMRGILIKIMIRITHSPVETGNPIENDGKYFNRTAKSLPNHLYSITDLSSSITDVKSQC